MNDRDTFAAAALTGLIACMKDESSDEVCESAYWWADAMLRERGVTKPMPKEKRAEVSYTTHDAAPAATADSADDRTDKAAPSQRRDCTGDISEAQIDALECVVEDGRIVGMSVYGHLRSLLVRLRPEWEAGPDPDSRVWETPRTPPPRATPPQVSVPGEGSVPDSRKWNEPVAWAVVHANGFGGVVDCYTSQQWCKHHFPGPHFRYVPLYRHPQPSLTDEERAAVERAIKTLDWWQQTGEYHSAIGDDADTLSKLLERTK